MRIVLLAVFAGCFLSLTVSAQQNEIPSISFCTLLADRQNWLGKPVRIYADMSLGMGVNLYLHDKECDQPGIGPTRTNERVGFAYDVEKLGEGQVIREILKQKGYETYVTHARVSIEGILRAETHRSKHNYPYKFIIERFLSVYNIVVSYGGELKEKWVYSDEIDHVRGTKLKLSMPLKPLIHHAQRIEWTNERKFQTLRRTGWKHITFRVLSKQTRQITRYRWNDIYTCEILEIAGG